MREVGKGDSLLAGGATWTAAGASVVGGLLGRARKTHQKYEIYAA